MYCCQFQFHFNYERPQFIALWFSHFIFTIDNNFFQIIPHYNMRLKWPKIYSIFTFTFIFPIDQFQTIFFSFRRVSADSGQDGKYACNSFCLQVDHNKVCKNACRNVCRNSGIGNHFSFFFRSYLYIVARAADNGMRKMMMMKMVVVMMMMMMVLLFKMIMNWWWFQDMWAAKIVLQSSFTWQTSAPRWLYTWVII